VPDDWGYGALSTWCIGNDEPGDPVVQRPEGAVEMIACIPASGYGISFFDSIVVTMLGPEGEVRQPGDASVPDGAWTGFATVDGGAGVSVVAASKDLAQRILDSAQRVEGVDGNGCAPKDGEGGSTGDSADDERVSVCRYDADGWLVQSERLSEEDTAPAMAALAAAPMRQEQEPCGLSMEFYDTVVIGNGADLGSVRVVWESQCVGRNGVFFSGVVRELTEDVLYWALSPGWSGGVSGDVPLPTELRR